MYVILSCVVVSIPFDSITVKLHSLHGQLELYLYRRPAEQRAPGWLAARGVGSGQQAGPEQWRRQQPSEKTGAESGEQDVQSLFH